MNIIAIDCGASFIKTAFVVDGRIIEKKEYDACKQNIGEVVSSKDSLLPDKLKNVVTIVRNTIKEYVEYDDLYIGMCNEMHGFVLANQDMIPYLDYVSWQKEYITTFRTEEETWKSYFEKKVLSEDILRTGMPFKAGLPSGNLAYIFESGLIKKEKNSRYLFFTLGDFIISWIFNTRIKIHPTNAAGTGLYDVEVGKWNDTLINSLNLSFIEFPEVDKNTEIIKINGIRVVSALGDQQAALYGAGLYDEKQISINMGTGAQVSVLSKNCIFDNNYQTRPFFKGMYLKTCPHIPSGRAINVFYGFVEEIIKFSCDNKEVNKECIWEWINRQALQAKSEDLIIDLSFFTNAVSNHTQGCICGIKENNFNIGNLFNSIYKQMAQNVKVCVDKLEIEYKITNEIVFSGGIVRKNELLRNLIMEKFIGYSNIVSENETFLGINKYICDVVKGE